MSVDNQSCVTTHFTAFSSTSDYPSGTICSDLEGVVVLGSSSNEECAIATTKVNQQQQQHVGQEISQKVDNDNNNCWMFYPPMSTTCFKSPSFIPPGRSIDSSSTCDISDTTAALLQDALAATPTLKQVHKKQLGELIAKHSSLGGFAPLRSCSAFPESHTSPLLDRFSDDVKECANDSNNCGLPSISFPDLASNDHLLDFVLRLTDTPPKRNHSENPAQEFKSNRSPFDVPQPPSMTDDDAHSLQCLSSTTLLLEDLPSLSSTVHRNPYFEHSLFSRSTTTASETHDGGAANGYLGTSTSHSNPLQPCTGTFSSFGLDAATTCRSTLSLVSNNTSLTTAASTPSGTPTWSQDLTTPSAATATITAHRPSAPPPVPQPQSSKDSLSTKGPLSRSPPSGRSDTPKGSIEDLLSDDELSENRSTSQKSSVAAYFPAGLVLPVGDRSVESDHDVQLPPVHSLSKDSFDLVNNRSVVTPLSIGSMSGALLSSPNCRNSTGLRHLHSGTATTLTRGFFPATIVSCGNTNDEYYTTRGSGQHESNSNSSYHFRGNHGGNDSGWNDDDDNNGYRQDPRRHLNNNVPRNGGINKGLTDFYSLAYASKRWQNLNVVLPLYVPHGAIAVIRSTGENTYVFSDQYPASQLLFSGAGKICDMWATYLRLRVAVIHKCPEFLVPRVAQVFNHVLANLPKFSEPINLRCAGVVKHTIQLRSSGGLTYRYDTIGQISNATDQEKMRVLFDALQKVMSEVNHYLAKEVEDVFRSLQGREGFDEGDPRGVQHGGTGPTPHPKCGLEFRFSPCKELKIAIREGTLCDCAGVDSVIAGGGASSMSAWAQQFIVENLIVGELRLERDKTSETQLDPFFLPHAEIKTRMISKDLDGNPARICFVDPTVYPDCYRPRVEYAIGLSPLQAAVQLVGGTHQPLAKLLPNGMNSLTSSSTGNVLHIPGVTLSQLYSTTAGPASGSLKGMPVSPYNERHTLDGVSFGRHQSLTQTTPPTIPFTLASSIPLNPSDSTSWPSGFSGSTSDQRPNPLHVYSKQHLGWDHNHISAQQTNDSNGDHHMATSLDTTNDTLKGLAVLQKMLSNLHLNGQTMEAKNGLGINDKSSEGLGKQQDFNTILGQAVAATMALGRHHQESTSRTTTAETASILSQLQLALQKIPYITSTGGSGVAAAAANQQSNSAGTPDSTSSPIFSSSSSPKLENSAQQTRPQQPHLSFPSIKALGGSNHPLYNIESVEDIGESTTQGNRTSMNDAEGGTRHSLIDEHELELFRGSKSVGATPAHYSVTTGAGGIISTSPTTTISSTSFIHAGGSTSQLHTKDLCCVSPTESTTIEPGNNINKNGFSSTEGSSAFSSTEDVDRRCNSFRLSGEVL